MKKIVYWKLNSGNKIGQETQEEKRVLGLEYIERLKKDGEEVLEVIDEGNRLKIILNERT